MNVLDLFSGIGGFSLGLERAGFTTVAFCEIDPFCQRVLRKHWPDVPIYDDIRTLPAIECDVICGGFPCQDISLAGRGAGLAGERSGLWRDMARAIRLSRPRWVIVENVAALLGRGLDTVLRDLAALGFDAEWHCIPASAVGAPHRRDRLWIIAHARGEQHEGDGASLRRPGAAGLSETDTHSPTLFGPSLFWREPDGDHAGVGEVADTNSPRLSVPRTKPPGENGRDTGRMFAASDWWRTEPDVGRVAHGVPSRVDRLRSLGNAVVPQIPELIGRAIMTTTPESRHDAPAHEGEG